MASKPFLQRSLTRTTSIFPKRQCRCLSSTSRLSLPAGSPDSSSPMRGMVQKSVSGISSMQSQMSKMQKSQLPDDIGMQPQILIKPLWKNLPSLISSQWRRRLRIEWMAFSQKYQNFLRLIYSAKWNAPVDPITNKKQRRPLLLRERVHFVRTLHTELNCAIAQRNRGKIEQIACDGLKRQLKVRFDKLDRSTRSRDEWTVKYKGWLPSEKTSWILQALCPPMFKAIRIIIDSEAPIPIGDDAYHRQVVARVRTTQTLARAEGKGPSKTVDLDEYVVIQRVIIEGKDEKWMIWGTVEPATEEQLDKLLDEASSDKFKDRFSEQFQKWSGGAASSL